MLARQLSADVGAVETILLRDGFLTEASASNVFVVKGGVVLAPPQDNLILLGITYDLLVHLAAEGTVKLEVRPITEAELRAADEVWLSSSTKEVLAVTTLDGKPVGNGKPGAGLPAHARALPGVQGRGLPRGKRSRLEARGCRTHLDGMNATMSDPPQPESLLTFPCVFPIKVMGRREDGFAQTVSEIVRRHAPDFHARDDRDAHLEERRATSRSPSPSTRSRASSSTRSTPSSRSIRW